MIWQRFLTNLYSFFGTRKTAIFTLRWISLKSWSAWRASAPRLEKKGFATHERIIQNGKPNKKLYSITDAGRKEFIRWLADGSENTTNDFKSAFLMKVFFSGNITPVQSLTILKNFAADCRLFLDSMHTIPGSIKQYSREVSPYEALHWQFTADFGYSYVRMCMEWAERCMHQLEEFL